MDPTTTTTIVPLVDQAAQVAKQALPGIQEVAGRLLIWLDQAHNFAMEQAPDLARQIVTWGIAQGLLYISLDLAWFIVGVMLLIWAHRNIPAKWREGNDFPFEFFPGVVGILIMIISSGSMFTNAWIALQAYVAPKVYLIEYLTKLAHK